MAPKARPTAREKSKRMVEMGHKTRMKEDYKAIMACHQGREDLTSKLFRDLVEWGELDERGRVLRFADGSAKLEDDEPQCEGADPTDEAAGDGGGQSTLHRNFCRWGLLPVGNLMALLQHCEPTTLSAGNVKCFVRRGCRFPPKETLLQLVEMMSDIDPDEDIGHLATLDSLADEMYERNCANGRRCRELQLPDGLEEGLWEAFLQPPLLKLRFRPTEQEVVIPRVLVKETDQVTFFLGFSKKRGYLKINGQGKVMCASAFAEQGVELCEKRVNGVALKRLASVSDKLAGKRRPGGSSPDGSASRLRRSSTASTARMGSSCDKTSSQDMSLGSPAVVKSEVLESLTAAEEHAQPMPEQLEITAKQEGRDEEQRDEEEADVQQLEADLLAMHDRVLDALGAASDDPYAEQDNAYEAEVQFTLKAGELSLE